MLGWSCCASTWVREDVEAQFLSLRSSAWGAQAASNPLSPRNQELKKTMPRMQENSPEKKPWKMSKILSETLGSRFFFLRQLKPFSWTSHDFSWPSQNQKKTDGVDGDLSIFFESFLHDLGSRRFCCSIFWGSTKKSWSFVSFFYWQAVLAQKFQGPHLGNFQGFSRCALERVKSWENPSWFRVKKGSQNAAKTSRWWNGCFFGRVSFTQN